MSAMADLDHQLRDALNNWFTERNILTELHEETDAGNSHAQRHVDKQLYNCVEAATKLAHAVTQLIIPAEIG